MSKFRYYITNPFNGCIEGTNNETVAISCASSEDFFVLDAETNEWLLSDGKRQQINETLSKEV